MKWRYVPAPPFDYTEWHIWFAWKPVRIGEYKHWLCPVYRKGKFRPSVTIYDQLEIVRFSPNDVQWSYKTADYYL